jgi:hypothetical protein
MAASRRRRERPAVAAKDGAGLGVVHRDDPAVDEAGADDRQAVHDLQLADESAERQGDQECSGRSESDPLRRCESDPPRQAV